MLIFVFSAHAQDRTTPPVGGGGGGEFSVRCPAGQLLGGVELSVGDDVNGIRPICRKPVRNDEKVEIREHYSARGDLIPAGYEDRVFYTVTDGTANTDWNGGTGESIRTIDCDVESLSSDGRQGGVSRLVVEGIYVEAEGVDLVVVNRISLKCGHPSFGPHSVFKERQRAADGYERDWWTGMSKSPQTFLGPRYDDVHTGGFESVPTKTKGHSDCPQSENGRRMSAVGIHGRAGKWVDALGLICELPIELPAPPAPIKAQGRVRVSVVSNDFNNDGRADVLWSNAATGQSEIWFMDGSSRIGRQTMLDYSSVCTRSGFWCIDPRWHVWKPEGDLRYRAPWGIAGTRDFNGDGKTDLLLYNNSTGEMQIRFMDGHKAMGASSVTGPDGGHARIELPWSIVGADDMNWDRKSDIIWHNSSTRYTEIWYMNGSVLSSRATVLGEDGSAVRVGLPWSIVGSGDFNRDTKTDLLWHNASTGATQIWLMNSHRIIGRAMVLGEDGVAPSVGLPWRITGTNDFDQDRSSDILWHNGSTRETQIWFMKGASIVRRATVDADRDGGGARVGLPWSIVSH